MTWNWIELAKQVRLGGREMEVLGSTPGVNFIGQSKFCPTAKISAGWSFPLNFFLMKSSPSKSIIIFSSENTSDLVVGQREVNLRIKVDSRKLVKTVSDADESLVRIPATRQSLEAEEK